MYQGENSVSAASAAEVDAGEDAGSGVDISTRGSLGTADARGASPNSTDAASAAPRATLSRRGGRLRFLLTPELWLASRDFPCIPFDPRAGPTGWRARSVKGTLTVK